MGETRKKASERKSVKKKNTGSPAAEEKKFRFSDLDRAGDTL